MLPITPFDIIQIPKGIFVISQLTPTPSVVTHTQSKRKKNPLNLNMYIISINIKKVHYFNFQITTNSFLSFFLLHQPMAELESPVVMSKLITFLSSLLERVAESNDLNRRFHPQKISVFHGLSRPTISVQSYLDRILKYANCSPSCFVVAYVYLDRFTQRQPTLPINSFNVHRLLITSVMVAAKFLDDM